MSVPVWAWIGTLAVFAVLISADLVLTRGPHGSSPRAAAVLSGLWIAAGLAFGGVLGLWQGSAIAGSITFSARSSCPLVLACSAVRGPRSAGALLPPRPLVDRFSYLKQGSGRAA